MSDETVAINLPPSIKERTRVLKSGKEQVRFTVEVRSEPIIHHFSDKELGRGPAEALAEIMRENLRNFARPVSAQTQRKRKYAAKAYDSGKSWAMKRYAGGRMGGRRPDPQSTTWFHDSGRMSESIYPTHNKTEGHYTINVAANRLHRESFGQGFERFLEVFSQAINAKGAADDRRFKKAQIDAVDNAILRAGQRLDRAKAQAIRDLAGLLRGGG